AWSRSRRLRRWVLRAVVACFAAALLAFLFLIVSPSEIPAVSLLTQSVIAVSVFGIIAGVLSLTQPEASTRAHARWSLVVLVIVARDLVSAGWGLNPTVPPRYYDPIRFELPLPRAYWTAAQEEQVKFERFFRFDDYQVAGARWREVRGSNLPNLNLLDRSPLLNNFEPLLVGHLADLIDLLEANPDSNASLLAASGVESAYTTSPVALPDGAGRAWLVSAACWHETEAE